MPIPVICVGNLTVGGSGKTPVTMALQNLLNDMGIKVCVVSRGYGGKIKGPHYVTQSDTFSRVGDEPLILSKKSSVIVSKNRKKGIIQAYKDGFDIVLLDDGYQNSKIKKDLSLVVVDSKILFGNKYVFPLGPLRESIQKGLSRADAIVFIINKNCDISVINDLNKSYNIKIIKGFIYKNHYPKTTRNLKVFAFSGIAYSEKFFNTAREVAYNVVKTKEYPDHYPYSSKDIEKLKNYADKHNLKLITTEKDKIRIPQRFHKSIDIIDIEFVFKDLSEIRNRIINFLK